MVLHDSEKRLTLGEMIYIRRDIDITALPYRRAALAWKNAIDLLDKKLIDQWHLDTAIDNWRISQYRKKYWGYK